MKYYVQQDRDDFVFAIETTLAIATRQTAGRVVKTRLVVSTDVGSHCHRNAAVVTQHHQRQAAPAGATTAYTMRLLAGNTFSDL